MEDSTSYLPSTSSVQLGTGNRQALDQVNTRRPHGGLIDPEDLEDLPTLDPL